MTLARDWNAGGGAIPPRGAERPSIRDLLNALGGAPSVTDVKAISPDERSDGQKLVTNDGRRWRFNASSVLTTDGDQLLIIPTVGTGVWCLEPGQVVDLRLAIAFGTADAAILYTMPTGSRIHLYD